MRFETITRTIFLIIIRSLTIQQDEKGTWINSIYLDQTSKLHSIIAYQTANGKDYDKFKRMNHHLLDSRLHGISVPYS
jgi:hypothetical protein